MHALRTLGLFLLLALLTACTPIAPSPVATEAPPAETPPVATEAPPAETPPVATEAPPAETPPVATDWYVGYSDAYPWPSFCCTRLTDMLFKPLVTVEYNYQTAEIIARPDLSLANDWGSDGDVAWMFKLREDVTWHDGAPFTAYDVEFTYTLLLDPTLRELYGNPGWQAVSLAQLNIENVSAVDDYTVRVDLSAPDPDLPRHLGAIYILPQHLLKDTDLDKLADLQLFIENPIGLGAFQFSEYTAGDAIALKPNPVYFLGAPKIESLIAQRVPDDAVKVAMADAGDLDVIHVTENQNGWEALGPLWANPAVRVQGYWAVNNRVLEMEPLGSIYDLPSYHKEEVWSVTDNPLQTSQTPAPSPAERILENVSPLEPLLTQNELSLQDFNFAAAVSFPPDTPEFTQAVVPVRTLPQSALEEGVKGLNDKILAIFYIDTCVIEAGCGKSGQDMAIRIKVESENSGTAQFLVWDDAMQSDTPVEEVPIRISGEVRDNAPVVAWFTIGNSHSITISAGGVVIVIPVPWHNG